MIADHLTGIEQFEADLWKVADGLRANSNLASNEYFMPILGLIFLRHATNRYYVALEAIEADKAAGGMPDRPLVEDDFKSRRALMLPETARFDVLLERPKDGGLGAAVASAMEDVEDHFPPLAGQLPKGYQQFEDDVLEEMMRTFDSEALRTASGDVFGRIYEYFLVEFSKQGAHDNGEFFTPPSIVQTIVNVIEPDHGVIFDPACGSGGMFVQSSHFIEGEGENTMERVTFYGHEKNETTAKLAQINLAVHGLQGTIRAGNEAITYYKDPHELVGACDFVMANPPFNVDEVDAEKVRGDKRLPFGLPGVNKAKKISNANYLWLQYFYSYLNESGRAGIVMSSQASSAGRDEAKVRQKLIETGAVDVMIDIRGNFFYTRTVPCQLWFLDRAKERDEARRDRVLMLDARNIYRKVTRAIFDFSREQQKNIAAIVWLYRGQTERFLQLVETYLSQALGACAVEVLMLGDWRAAAGEVGFWPECGHLARPTLGWKALTGRPERKRFAFHTRSMGTARPGASALAGQHLPQHVATLPIRLMFNAKHTRSHSPRTFAKPRRLNRRNPSTSLIHPFGASESHLRCAYRALPAGLASFSPMRCVAGSRAGSTATWDLPSRPSATCASMPRSSSSNRSGSLQ